MRKFLVVLLILLAALVVVADIGGRSFAQNMVARQIANQMQMAEEPTVSIEGWAFLPQAISGTYSEINIAADTAAMSGVTVEQVDVTATDVEAPLADLMSRPSVVAGELEGTVVVPYSYFNPYLPEGITITNEGGEPHISGELALPELGISTSVTSGGEFTVDGDTLHVTPVDLQLGGSLDGVNGLVSDMLTISFQAPQMPFGLAITDMEATSSGLRITGAGSDVPLMGSEAV